jgi:hypothetical protein
MRFSIVLANAKPDDPMLIPYDQLEGYACLDFATLRDAIRSLNDGAMPELRTERARYLVIFPETD